jgi:hypothetical protein
MGRCTGSLGARGPRGQRIERKPSKYWGHIQFVLETFEKMEPVLKRGDCVPAIPARVGLVNRDVSGIVPETSNTKIGNAAILNRRSEYQSWQKQ